MLPSLTIIMYGALKMRGEPVPGVRSDDFRFFPGEPRLTWPCLSPFAFIVLGIMAGCASVPPGAGYPKADSTAISAPETTRFGRQFADAADRRAGQSGFRIFNAGVDGFLMRLEMINAAERALDLQYYIFRGDESGRLLSAALLRAADRGVRVRVLVDDGDTVTGDEQLLALSGHGKVEIRVFNPWAYRGHATLRRGLEFIQRRSRLDYRMHNKLFIADGAVALVGGRNIGDQYFQIDPGSQFADDDVFAVGPITHQLSAGFDEFWNSRFAIPAEALSHSKSDAAPSSLRASEAASGRKLRAAGFNYSEKLAAAQPLAGILSGELPLVWADAQFVHDSPDKRTVVTGARLGDLMYEPVARRLQQIQTELIVVTPYFVPTREELHQLKLRRESHANVRILTNSLESNPNIAAHAGYMHYRAELLRQGVQLHEIRSLLGDSRGSGESKHLSRYGHYALHAKLYIFDRKALFIGSMNYDFRSRRLNTEMGLIIDNAELSEQEASRFDAMTGPENSYAVELRSEDDKACKKLVWRTAENHQLVEYDTEPARSVWQKVKARLLFLLPLETEL
jgi:putative cardiolipin synthase